MNAKIKLCSPEYFLDFVYAKIKLLWPAAVIVDASADERHCSGQHLKGYGSDIFRSSEDLEALFSGECYNPPPYLNVCCKGKVAHLCGSIEAVKQIMSQPLWRD